MVAIRWTEQAIADINAIAVFIAKDSVQAAQGQVLIFFDRVEVLRSFPITGRKVPQLNDPQIRELIIGSHRLVYEIISMERIDVLTVHHASRMFLKNN